MVSLSHSLFTQEEAGIHTVLLLGLRHILMTRAFKSTRMMSTSLQKVMPPAFQRNTFCSLVTTK